MVRRGGSVAVFGHVPQGHPGGVQRPQGGPEGAPPCRSSPTYPRSNAEAGGTPVGDQQPTASETLNPFLPCGPAMSSSSAAPTTLGSTDRTASAVSCSSSSMPSPRRRPRTQTSRQELREVDLASGDERLQHADRQLASPVDVSEERTGLPNGRDQLCRQAPSHCAAGRLSRVWFTCLLPGLGEPLAESIHACLMYQPCPLGGRVQRRAEPVWRRWQS